MTSGLPRRFMNRFALKGRAAFVTGGAKFDGTATNL